MSSTTLIKRIKVFFKTREFNLIKKIPLESLLVVKNYLYKTKPFNLYIKTISIFNNEYILPGVPLVNPGYFIYKKRMDNYRNTFLNMITPLKNIPFDMIVCYIKNKLNNK